MRILGIDPGSNVTGWGLVRMERGRYRFEGCGVVRTKPADPVAQRLVVIHAGVAEVVGRERPDEVAIEDVFHHKSSESAIRLGQARGVALLALAQAGYDVEAYNPMVVKRSVGASGKADKAAIARMVKMLLGVDLDVPADATDALAIAITHAAHRRGLGRVAS